MPVVGGPADGLELVVSPRVSLVSPPGVEERLAGLRGERSAVHDGRSGGRRAGRGAGKNGGERGGSDSGHQAGAIRGLHRNPSPAREDGRG